MRVLALKMVLFLHWSLLSGVATWLVAGVFRRLSFVPYLAGVDVRGFSRRLLSEVRRKSALGQVDRMYLRRWVAVLFYQAWHGPARRRRSRHEFGAEPPAFAILSPSAACNLRCAHCYAATGEIPQRTVSHENVGRLVDGLERAGTNLVILSGGEPLIWRDRGRGLVELAASRPTMLFIVYTNGTLLDGAVAKQLAALGNVLPLISVEGDAPETDMLRGAGVFAKVRQAAAHLDEVGMLFGLSITAAPYNEETLRDPAFYEDVVDEMGASFIWTLDLADLGRAEGRCSCRTTCVTRWKLR